MATITSTSARDSQRLRKAIERTSEQGPSSREMSGTRFGQGIMDGLDYQDPTSVTFSFLRRMRRDHIISMGLHFITMPLIKAVWFMDSDDARAAAFADNLIRPIFPELVEACLRFLWSGYSPMVKVFKTVQPEWKYIEAGEPKKVWDNGSIEALVFDEIKPLKPEVCVPKWTDTGRFDGIAYDQSYGQGFFVVQGNRKPEIDVNHALWATHDSISEDGCQPPGEQVLTTEGYVSIEELDASKHKLVSYNPQSNKIHRGIGSSPKHKGYSFEVFERPHQGEMITIEAGGPAMRCTTNHKLTVRWSPEAENHWAVYLMRKGDHWRIGTTQIIKQKERQKNSGLGYRLWQEQGDQAWILDAFDSKTEALFHEALWSQQYAVPDLCFQASNHTLTQDQIDSFWSQVDSEPGAKRLLADHHRELAYPLYERESGKQSARQVGTHYRWTIHAANLMSGLMELPLDPGTGMTPTWSAFDLSRESYDGPVYSLQVDPYKHYVSGGVITRNSPWGFPRIAHAAPIFHTYRFMWKLIGRAFENSADPGPVVYFPSTEIANWADGVKKTIQQRALAIGTSRRSGSTVALPSDVWTDFQDKPTGVRKWAIEYPEIHTNFESMQSFLGALESAKFRAIWLQEQGMIEGSGGQSNRNVASEFGSQRDASQAVLMGQVVQLIMNYLVKPAMAINMPEFSGRLEMKTLGFGQDDEDLVRQVIQLTMAADQTNFGVDVERLLAARGLPMKDPLELKRLREEAIKRQAQLPAPAVQPNEGRRAKVTQTGFNRETGQAEMSYVQLGQDLRHIDLGGDEEFVSSLPRIEAFSDKNVVGFTRELRWETKNFLSWMYDNFARYVSRVNLGSIDAELDEDIAIEDRPDAIAQSVLNGWNPRIQRVDEFSSRTNHFITCAYNRGAHKTIKELDASINLNPFDRDYGNPWISTHTTKLSEDILAGLGQHLLDVVADGVREGSTNKQIAAEVRDRFTDVPDDIASTHARRQAVSAYNHGVMVAGLAAGVKKVQTLNDGEILPIADAMSEVFGCSPEIRLLRGASENLSVITAELDGRRRAMYDPNGEQIMFSPEVTEQERVSYLLMVGEKLSVPSGNGIAEQPQAGARLSRRQPAGRLVSPPHHHADLPQQPRGTRRPHDDRPCPRLAGHQAPVHQGHERHSVRELQLEADGCLAGSPGLLRAQDPLPQLLVAEPSQHRLQALPLQEPGHPRTRHPGAHRARLPEDRRVGSPEGLLRRDADRHRREGGVLDHQ